MMGAAKRLQVTPPLWQLRCHASWGDARWRRGCDFAAEDDGVTDYRSSGALLEIAILQHLKLTFGRDNTAVRGLA